MRKWHDIYANDNELVFFQCVARGRETWMTVSEVAFVTQLSKRVVQDIIIKYSAQGLLVWHELRVYGYKFFCYFEKAPEKYLPQKRLTITQADQKHRIEEELKKHG
jgi:predicted DNA-binding transcriptional regulator